MPSPTSSQGKKRKLPCSPSASPASMNFRRQMDKGPGQSTGTRPLPEPASVQQVLLLMVVHLCRKILFIEEYVKVGIYLGSVFIGSIISDVLPLPPTYFSRKNNFFNSFFVKYSWGWTMVFVVCFVYLTSRVYTCRNKDMIKKHMLRMIIATGVWLFWTKFFVKVEDSYGLCSKPMKVTDKYHCTSQGHKWYGFSISGHSFILIYCALLIKEEAKALIGWDGLKDMIRNEEHNRSLGPDTEKDDTQLEKLSSQELAEMKLDLDQFTPYIRGLFIAMTALALLWDVMLITTILYFHTMVEKFLGSVIAIFMWFITYRFWYRQNFFSPGLAGEGTVPYMNPIKPLESVKLKRKASLKAPEKKDRDKLPTFMGMPLYSLRNQESIQNGQSLEESCAGSTSKSLLEP